METPALEQGEEKPKFDFDRLWLGLLLGAIGPFLGFLGYYAINYLDNEFWPFVDTLLRSGMYVPVMKLCVIVNLLIFFIFIWTHKYRSARGVLAFTFIYAFIIVYLSLTA